ncbi:DNA polymerase III subunit alpha [Candidatus Parcubacteria bacterium]|nr:DNA polymerase III subunit alpha [Candidatus Parcubacteria bacterium]
MSFVHLHTHSHYSLLTALPKVKQLVAAAKKDGATALALTDNGNMYGAIEFYKRCKDEGIKAILGVDFYLALRTRFDKQPGVDNRRFRLVLLAENLAGYKNLIKLVTASNLEGFYYKPRVDKDLLRQHSEGLIALIPSFSGDTTLALKSGDIEKADFLVSEYKSIFGENNVFLELSHHPEIEGHEATGTLIKELGKRTNTPLAAAHDTYYIHPEDKRARETLVSIQSNTDFEKNGFQEDASDFSFITEKKALELFKNEPEALANTAAIAERCNVSLDLGKWVFPNLKIEEGKTYDQALRDVVMLGFERRNVVQDETTMKRVNYELEVIEKKGYAPYFLVVADLLRFAHENHIFTTIRGSVAGSMVTYLAGITNVNPLEYKLPFERFLNPERPSAPDIDMDYADNRRDEMLEYARQKYGRDHVAQIGTFGTMMARGAVRDVTRAMGFSYAIGDRIAKLIPFGAQGFPMTIDRALEETAELKEIYDKEAEAKEIIEMAKKIEGCARHISIHAAGVVISPVPLNEMVPLQFDPKEGDKIITQYDMRAVEEAGLLKFDFLGIRNLAILADAVQQVNARHGGNLDIERIPLDDPKTFAMLAKGETMGLFQLNGSGMTRYLKELKPTTIHDINAMVALYRPGPMESIPMYIERKQDASKVSYLDPRLRTILDQSYGVITYQDDVMLIAIELAGYSWLEADKLRKAMGKKIPAEMEAQKEHLRQGFVEHGLTPGKAEALWKLIEPFASYGFNKAHAASYGRVAYQTAFMKANYPGEYMTAVLTAESGNTEEVATIIHECKRMGIPVLPPEINQSYKDFTLVEEGGKPAIRFGLGSIKNFGEGIAEALITEREARGPFKSLADFLERLQNRNLNKKSLESLIYAGAFDNFAERARLLASVEDLLTYNRESGKQNSDQSSLFGGLAMAPSTIRLQEAPPMEMADKLRFEKELLGLYVSGHPLDRFQEKLSKAMTIKHIREEMKPGMVAVVSGIVEEVKPILTKKGDKMIFLKMSDFTGVIELVVFPKIYQPLQELFIPDRCIAVRGAISAREGELSILADAAKPLTV